MSAVSGRDRREAVPSRILLTVLGTRPRKACYELGGKTAEAQLAPLALINLLPQENRPRSVVALCTPEAKKESLPLLREGLAGQCELTPIDVPAGDSQTDINDFLTSAARAIPEDSRPDLLVDVTHGYRHFSLLVYVLVLYLASLREVRLRGAYYGLLRQDSAPSPFLDMRPLLALPRWFHALEVLRTTGSALPIAEILTEGESGRSSQTIARELREISSCYLSGLPLELGRCARNFCDQRLRELRRILNRDHQLPLAEELVKLLLASLDPFALSSSAGGDSWKTRVSLTKEELERQTGIIEDLFKRGSASTALGLLSEWTVSWIALHMGLTTQWLDYRKVRKRAAQVLGAMEASDKDPLLSVELTEGQRRIASFWRRLSGLRNAYHHHGMRPRVLIPSDSVDQSVKQVLHDWRELLRSPWGISLSFGDSKGGLVLISPLGQRPGVLFSAVHAFRAKAHCVPDLCLVICSRQTQGSLAEATERAGYRGEIQPLCLDDPFGGRPEIERLVKDASPRLLRADKVFVNVTGGTTLMGLAAEALADKARSLARPVQRFGLIDRRDPHEQVTDPYRSGEPFWLDGVEESNDEDN